MSAVAGLVVGSAAIVAAAAALAGGFFLLARNQSSFFAGIAIVGVALASTVVVGPLSASLVTTWFSEACTEMDELAWQPGVLALAGIVAGAAAGVAWDTAWGGGLSVDGDLALSAGIGALALGVIGAGVGGAWFAGHPE